MNEELIIELLEARGAGSAVHLDDLKKMVDDHPYFTAGRLLLLKSLQEKESLGYDPELKRTAAHIPSRRKLFEWVSKPLADNDSSVIQEPEEEKPIEVAPPIEMAASPEKATEATKLEEAPAESPKPVEERSKTPTKEEGYNPIIPDHVNDPAAEARLRVQKILEARRAKQAPPVTEPPKEEKKEDPSLPPPPTKSTTPTEPEIQEVKIEVPEVKTEIKEIQPEVQEKVQEPSDVKVSFSQPVEIEKEPTPVEDSSEENITSSAENNFDTREKGKAAGSPAIDFIVEDIQDSVENSSFEIEEVQESVTETKQNSPSETHSFIEWMELFSSEESNQHRKKQDSLVEKFLKDPPSFRPKKEKLSTESKNIAAESLQENPEIMTETLALLYIEQGHFDKAVQAYEILGLRFPEKSGFFAGRIRELKKRIKDKK